MPLCLLQVLVGDRQAVQRPDLLTARERRVGGVRPRRGRRSAASVTMALTVGLTRSIWARCASITSRAESSRA